MHYVAGSLLFLLGVAGAMTFSREIQSAHPENLAASFFVWIYFVGTGLFVGSLSRYKGLTWKGWIGLVVVFVGGIFAAIAVDEAFFPTDPQLSGSQLAFLAFCGVSVLIAGATLLFGDLRAASAESHQ